ncbi:hypothetical protein GGR57DRAFT_473074 [Xylariaceae sp. FL1272]|nr:hypothetical protein GGR57DRAFT_473074 [Xylariaceae sp. FL1272]
MDIILLVLALVTGFAYASPLQAGEEDRIWTISNATRQRASNDSSVCNWHMMINDYSSPDAIPFTCDFVVPELPNQDCGLKTFHNLPCSSNETFTISGGHEGHNGTGFIVAVASNTADNTQAWFGFADDALDTGAKIAPQNGSVGPATPYEPGKRK